MPHIGDVTHITHLITLVLKIAEKHIKGDGRACMSQVGVAINRWSTHIHPHVGSMQGLKQLFATGECIVN